MVEQARPAQIHLLQQMGEMNPELRAAAVEALRCLRACNKGREIVQSQLAAAEQLLEDVSGAAARAPKQPPCVCGSRLMHVSYRERLVRYVVMRFPHQTASHPQLDDLVDRNLERGEPCYFCDLCGDSKAQGGVWTCENGNNTVLHANAYDVCENCFALYCAGEIPSS